MVDKKKSARPAVPEEVRLAEARALKTLWDSRKAVLKLDQAGFGGRHGMQTQSQVSGFLNGKRPLHLKAALAFAQELKCDVSDFSERLADAIDLVKAMGSKGALPPHLSFLNLSTYEADVVGWMRAVGPEERKIHQFASALYANYLEQQGIKDAKAATENANARPRTSAASRGEHDLLASQRGATDK
jgi:hypothetical protein